MIKIFGKIRQQLITHHRLGKYILYALGEIVLVVIGILIALQINNWNEAKKQKTKETVLLIELKSNLETNIANLENDIRTQNASMRYFDYIMDLPDHY
ncbi:MAG: DUF6090 family protein, partial [Maribacter sp.]|nr:DUF6090 family protein [Maribacter sp.]